MNFFNIRNITIGGVTYRRAPAGELFYSDTPGSLWSAEYLEDLLCKGGHLGQIDWIDPLKGLDWDQVARFDHFSVAGHFTARRNGDRFVVHFASGKFAGTFTQSLLCSGAFNGNTIKKVHFSNGRQFVRGMGKDEWLEMTTAQECTTAMPKPTIRQMADKVRAARKRCDEAVALMELRDKELRELRKEYEAALAEHINEQGGL